MAIDPFRLQEMPPMIASARNRFAVCIGAAIALLADCGGSQPPIGTAGAMSQSVSRSGAHTQVRPAKGAVGSGVAVEYAYLVDFSGGVGAYSINMTTGALTQVEGGSEEGAQPDGIAIDPTGKFVYVADYLWNAVAAYAINVTTGTLTPVKGSPFAAGYGPEYVAIDPRGKFAYVTDAAGPPPIAAYSIDKTTGALTLTGSFDAGDGPADVVVDPRGKFAYVTNIGSDNVSAYTINAANGALTQIAGSPFAAGSYPWGVAIDPTGKFAYVPNGKSDNVSAYTIIATSGALTQVKGSPFAAGTGPFGVAVDRSGKFAYVTNYGATNVSAYTINETSGALKQVKGSPFAAGTEPLGVAVDPTGKFAYVANVGFNSSGDVSAYTINATNGALKQVKGSPFSAGDGPFAIATCRVKSGKCIPPPL
jgi:6-phosphogluconolactonase